MSNHDSRRAFGSYHHCHHPHCSISNATVGTDILGLKFTPTAQPARVKTSSGDQIVEEVLPCVSHARQYHKIDGIEVFSPLRDTYLLITSLTPFPLSPSSVLRSRNLICSLQFLLVCVASIPLTWRLMPSADPVPLCAKSVNREGEGSLRSGRRTRMPQFRLLGAFSAGET